MPDFSCLFRLNTTVLHASAPLRLMYKLFKIVIWYRDDKNYLENKNGGYQNIRKPLTR